MLKCAVVFVYTISMLKVLFRFENS